MSEPPASAVEPHEPIGAILLRWRKRKGLTGQALGKRVGMSQAKISRLETGAVAAEPADVRLIAHELGVPPAEVDRIVELAEHADDRLLDWTFRGLDIATFQREYGRIEAAASELRAFQPAVVPGLIQTSEYARAVLSDLRDEVDDIRLADSAAVSEAVNARMLRNQILLEPDHEFHFLITEQVLRNQVSRPANMIAQIDRLREVAAYPNVHLRIITDGSDLPIAPYHGFVVADDRWVSVDLFNTSLSSKGAKTIRTYRRIFDALEGVAEDNIDELLDRYEAQYARTLLPDAIAN